jgi:hypothetical protein
MLNAESITQVNASRYTAEFLKPLYGNDTFGFANIPRSVQALLMGTAPPLPASCFAGLRQQYDAVVLIFVDAFGWYCFERYADELPFLQRFIQTGIASKLTSMFPSTTTAHVTCIHTGQTPAQSGMYEWFIYDPTIDDSVAPLLFSLARDKNREGLAALSYNAHALFPRRTLYQDLADAGVQSFVYQSNAFAFSSPTQALCAGAKLRGYKTLPQAMVQLGRDVALQQRQRTGPSYYQLYFGDIDSIAHEFGPDSAEVDAEVRAFFTLLEMQLVKALAGQNVLLMVTADHGQTALNPKDTLFLNQHIPNFAHFLQRNQRGDLIRPSGCPRDSFWHIQPARLDEAEAVVRACVGERALVVRTQLLVDAGFFGPQPTQALLSRLGNLLVLPYKGQAVWWQEPPTYKTKLLGNHGGLTHAEAEIPFLVCAL